MKIAILILMLGSGCILAAENKVEVTFKEFKELKTKLVNGDTSVAVNPLLFMYGIDDFYDFADEIIEDNATCEELLERVKKEEGKDIWESFNEEAKMPLVAAVKSTLGYHSDREDKKSMEYFHKFFSKVIVLAQSEDKTTSSSALALLKVFHKNIENDLSAIWYKENFFTGTKIGITIHTTVLNDKELREKLLKQLAEKRVPFIDDSETVKKAQQLNNAK